MFERIEESLWIERIRQSNDEEAFRRLTERYRDAVFRFFLMQTGGDRAGSDDLAQETFVRIWLHLKELSHFASFRPWLFRIAWNVWNDSRREAARRPRQTESEERLIYMADREKVQTPDNSYECRDRLMYAMQTLTETERWCVNLFYLQDMSISQVGQITGYKEGTVKSLLSRAREKMK